MNLHTAAVHKSDPASDRAKVPTRVRPKLEAESTKAQVELFEQEWALYCSPHWPEAVKMSELKQVYVNRAENCTRTSRHVGDFRQL